MDNKALKDYIEKELERGFVRKDIKKALLDVGYSEENIDNCFVEMSKKEGLYDLVKKEVNDSSTKRYLIFAVFSIIVLGIGIYALITWSPIDMINSGLKNNDTGTHVPEEKEYIPFTPSIKDQLKGVGKRVTNLGNSFDFGNEDQKLGEPDKFYTKMSQENLDCIYENKISVLMCKAAAFEDEKYCNELNRDVDKS